MTRTVARPAGGGHRGVPRRSSRSPTPRRSSRCSRAGRRCCRAPRLSERVGADVLLKVEGANPTGSFKDRGMTMAISKAVEEGAKAVVCASTGNTSASAAAYAARAGLTCAVLIPEGHIALGKLAQALMHGARVLQVRGNFDAGPRPSSATSASRRRSPWSTRSTRYRIEGQKTGRLRDRRRARRRPRRPLHPGRQRRQHHRLLEGLPRVPGGRPRRPSCPRMLGFQAAGAAPHRARATRSSTPRRSPPPSASATRPSGTAPRRPPRESGGAIARGDRRRDPRRLPVPGRRGVGVLRGGVGGVGGRPAQGRAFRRARPSSAC